MAVTTWIRATPSISTPVRQMKSVSPRETPLSMIWAFRLGRYSAAMVEANWKRMTAAIYGRYGFE